METRESLVRKELAQAANLEVAAVVAREQLKMAELDVKIRLENYKLECAKDFHNHFFLFADLIDLRNITNCIETLGIWDRLAPECDIEIALHSPGGHTLPGMALFDYIGRLRRTHKVTTSVLGYAASMAAVLLQAGTHRVMGAESTVFIHEISAQAVGKIGEIEDITSFIHSIQSRIIDIFVSRSAGRIDRETFKKNWERREWCLDAPEMLKWGFVDEVV
jgi:ATP-dependent Clp protease protease subunit